MKDKSKGLNRIDSNLRWILQFMNPNCKWLISIFIASLVTVAFSLLKVLFIKEIINSTINAQKHYLVKEVIILIILIIGGVIANYIQNYASGIFAAAVSKDIREKIIRRVERISFISDDNSRSSDLISILNNEIWLIQIFLREQLANLISQPIMMIFAYIYILYINWKLAIVSFIICPISMYATIIISKKITSFSKEYYANLGMGNSVIQDSIRGIVVVKSFNLEKHLYGRCESFFKKALHYGLEIEKRKVFNLPLIILMYESPFILCVLYGGTLSINGEIQAANLIAFIQLLSYIIEPMVNIPQMVTNIRNVTGAIERISEVEKIENERIDGNEFDINNQEKIIEFNNVSFEYKDNTKVLKNISFSIKKGQRIAIVGCSGSGKSTILNLTCGFYDCSDGNIYIFNKDIREWNLQSLRKKISYVSQEAYIFPGTIMENIKCGRNNIIDEDIYLAAKAANAHEFILKMPEGYNTVIGEGKIKLSGGEKQRISIARAFARDSPILLLDEPTSAQDYCSESAIIEGLNNYKGGKTIISITHRLWTLKDFDLILVLKDTLIVECGNYIDLMNKKGVYYNLYNKSSNKC
ncbi:ABC transporter ATP-binding protein/permease [Clostridium estertheticum]|uniref:ABC transporter ATP-binding protein n=1 Tax=Clostridium estertheticum TaxID=238834 RepID=UPI001C0E4BF0|nr:ABC transporter ATP-binding protein [Clostridium estertheticum]MBU3198533.1 ABC transporter ATP-binding protein/permease [Clostridium estertheticum]WAG64513.1 ABC transporter ATP-binding protein/permease [Clostridium estertheticum]